jgi:hypothetical protein
VGEVGLGISTSPDHCSHISLKPAFVASNFGREGLRTKSTTGASHFALSASGSLVYVPGERLPLPRKLIWADRKGFTSNRFRKFAALGLYRAASPAHGPTGDYD